MFQQSVRTCYFQSIRDGLAIEGLPRTVFQLQDIRKPEPIGKVRFNTLKQFFPSLRTSERCPKNQVLVLVEQEEAALVPLQNHWRDRRRPNYTVDYIVRFASVVDLFKG